MLIGYARVSTLDQNLDLQLDALKLAGCEAIYSDKLSGAKTDRPELLKALKACKDGDTLIVWKLDRLGRSLKHLVDTISDLANRGVGFKTVKDNIDTTSSTGKLVFHIFAALAQFERELTKDRITAGIAAAKKRGKHLGRPKLLTSEQETLVLELTAVGKSQKEIARVLKVSQVTVWRTLTKVS